MVLVLETFVCPNEIKLVGILLAQTRQNVDFNLALTSIRRVILQDFDSHDLISALLPAFDHLKRDL